MEELVNLKEVIVLLSASMDRRFDNCVEMRMKLKDHIDKVIDALRNI